MTKDFVVITPLQLKGPYIKQMTDKEFVIFCQSNNSLFIERLASREILISISQSFSISGVQHEITQELVQWNNEFGKGAIIFNDSWFLLNNSAVRKPALAWLNAYHLEHRFAGNSNIINTCPDFVLEIKRPESDLKQLKSKMKEWISNGCRLAWLVDEKKRIVYIFEKSKVPCKSGLRNLFPESPSCMILEFTYNPQNFHGNIDPDDNNQDGARPS